MTWIIGRLEFALTLALALVSATLVTASDFPRLDEALPGDIDVVSIAPVFDFDSDGCLPGK